VIRRLAAGLLEGLIVGGAGALVVRQLGASTWTPAAAYAAALAVGAVTGLVAGKPMWRAGAGIEGTLKAIAGAGLGALVLWAWRRWASFPVDGASFGLGAGAAGENPAASLVAVAVALALLFELDDTPAPATTSSAPRRGAARFPAGSRVEEAAGAEEHADAPGGRRRGV
jgi:hypothetical protein